MSSFVDQYIVYIVFKVCCVENQERYIKKVYINESDIVTFLFAIGQNQTSGNEQRHVAPSLSNRELVHLVFCSYVVRCTHATYDILSSSYSSFQPPLYSQ